MIVKYFRVKEKFENNLTTYQSFDDVYADSLENKTKLYGVKSDVERIDKDFTAFSAYASNNITDLAQRTSKYQSETSSNIYGLQQNQNDLNNYYKNVSSDLGDIQKDVRSYNNKIEVINGKIVDISNAQQSYTQDLSRSLLASNEGLLNITRSNFGKLISDVNSALYQNTSNLDNRIDTQYNYIDNLRTIYNSNINTLNSNVNTVSGNLTQVNTNLTNNINNVNSNLNTNYVKKTDLTTFSNDTMSIFATKMSLNDYYQKPLIDNMKNELQTSIRQYTPLSNFDTLRAQLSNQYTPLSTISSLQVQLSNQYAQKTALDNLQSQLTGQYALKTSLDNYYTLQSGRQDRVDIDAIRTQLSNDYVKNSTLSTLTLAAASNSVSPLALSNMLSNLENSLRTTDPKFNSVGRVSGDRFNIYASNTTYGTAAFGGMSIADGGGLVVGGIRRNAQGDIYAESNIEGNNLKARSSVCVGSNCLSESDVKKAKTDTGIIADSNGVYTLPTNLKTLAFQSDNPGPMLQKAYGTDLGNRYGFGQFNDASTKMYASGIYAPASASISLSKSDGTFDDVVTVKNDKSTTFLGDTNARYGTMWVGRDSNGNYKSKLSQDGLIEGDILKGRTKICVGGSCFTESDIGKAKSLDLNVNSIGRYDTDWFRIYGTTNNGVAVYNGMSVNEGGGLAVGRWGKANQGDIYAESNIEGSNLRARSQICAGTACMTQDDIIKAKNPSPISIGLTPDSNGIYNLPQNFKTFSLQPSDPGAMIEKKYGANDHRFGIGQFGNATMRMYSASLSANPNATTNLSLAKSDGTFDDVVTVKTDKSTTLLGDTNVKGAMWIGQDTSGNYKSTIAKDGTIEGDTLKGRTQICAGGACMSSNDIAIAKANNSFNGNFSGNYVQSGNNSNDWAWKLFNNSKNGNRGAYMAHGDGYGMHINTGDSNPSKYALELHNGARTIMKVQNDGKLNAGPINTLSIGRDDGDWFYINGGPVGTALKNGMNINENGGLLVGDWSRKADTGNIEATKNISAGANISGDIVTGRTKICANTDCLTPADIVKAKSGGSSGPFTGDTATSNIRMDSKTIFLQDENKGLRYRNNLDGPELYGWSGGSLSTRGAGVYDSLTWDSYGNVWVRSQVDAQNIKTRDSIIMGDNKMKANGKNPRTDVISLTSTNDTDYRNLALQDVYANGWVRVNGQLCVGGQCADEAKFGKAMSGGSGTVTVTKVAILRHTWPSDGEVKQAVNADYPINNVALDEIGINLDSASRQFTLPAGTYEIDCRLPMVSYGGRNMVFLYNVTDGVEVARTSKFSGPEGQSFLTVSDYSIIAKISINNPKTYKIKTFSNGREWQPGFGTYGSQGENFGAIIYIKTGTNMIGNVIAGSQLCVGGTCIDENQLKTIINSGAGSGIPATSWNFISNTSHSAGSPTADNGWLTEVIQWVNTRPSNANFVLFENNTKFTVPIKGNYYIEYTGTFVCNPWDLGEVHIYINNVDKGSVVSVRSVAIGVLQFVTLSGTYYIEPGWQIYYKYQGHTHVSVKGSTCSGYLKQAL